MPVFQNLETGEEIEIEDPANLRGLAEENADRARKAERRAKQAEEELAPYRARERERMVEELVGPLGKQAKSVWLEYQGDVTPTEELVEEFAAKHGFAASVPAEEEAPPVATPPTPGYQPVANAEVPAPSTTVSMPEFSRITRENPARAAQLLSEGKVDLPSELVKNPNAATLIDINI